MATSRSFSAYRINLEIVPSFKYLGRVLSATYDDWPKVIQNLTKTGVV